MNGVSAAILAGGLGTRLRSVVSDRPKVLAPVAGRPFLSRLLDQLADAGFREVVLLTGFAADAIRSEFGESHCGVNLIHSREPEPLGTGGALRLALPLLTAESILLLNGDSYCDVDFASLVERHRAVHAAATLTLTDVSDASRFGRVVQDKGGRVVRFEEKGGAEESGRINAGVYLFEREVVESILPNRAVPLERETLPDWVGRGRVFGHPGGRFIDIGTPESFAAAEKFFR